MPDIPASEYIESLLVAYKQAERNYNQAVSDVVAAERRRDEAKKSKDEAFTRLDDARRKYGISIEGSNSENNPVVRTNRPPKSLTRKSSQNSGKKKQVRGQSIRQAIAESESSRIAVDDVPKSPTNDDKGTKSSPVIQRQSISAPHIVLSPTAGQKKAPKIFLTNPESPRRRSSNRLVPLLPMEDATHIFDIAKGRSRDWYDKNFDCEACGLVKKFYQAAFGTKTSEKTQKVTVRTIVLNDEWNDLVTDTSQIQEMYIGKSADKDSKRTLRDRAAEALVNPPQQDPVALFFAPKKLLNTNEIFYGGHWKVIDGKMLHPPRAVKGQLRQCLAKFVFVGIDRQIVDAINM